MEGATPGRLLRLFLALPLPGSVRRELEEIRAALPGSFRGLRSDNFHLTLAFLGDTPEDRVPEIEAILQEACAGVLPFEGSLGGFGAFPHGGEPRVVWAGLAAGAVPAGTLAEALRRALRRRGIPFDRKPFKAHITVAYARRDLGREGLRKAGDAFMEFLKARGREAAAPDLDGAFVEIAVEAAAPNRGGSLQGASRFLFEEAVLMQSDLGPGGSVFTALCRAPLGGDRRK